MKKLLILPALLAMSTLSGGAFAQRGSSGSVGGSPSVTITNGSVVTYVPTQTTPVRTVTTNTQTYVVVPGQAISIGAPPSSIGR